MAGEEVGVGYVSVLPSGRGFERKLKELLPKDPKLVVDVKLDEKDFKRRTDKIRADFADLGGHFAGITAAASAVGPALSAGVAGASALGAGLASIVGAVGPAVGVLGALPVALIAGAQAGGVAKFALEGVAAAAEKVSAAAGDPAKLQKALAELTPEAARLATTLAATKPALDGLRQSAQHGLFPGLESSLSRLTVLAPRFRADLESTGKVLGDVAVGGTDLLVKRQGLLHEILRGNLPILAQAGGGALHLGDAFLHVAHAAQPMTLEIAGAAAQLAAYIEHATTAGDQSGRLGRFFHTAWVDAQQLGRIVEDVAVGLAHVFKAGAGDGQHLLDTTEQLTEHFREWTTSADGVARLGKWFDDGHRNAEALARVVEALRRNLTGFGDGGLLAPLLDKLSGPGGLVDALGGLVHAANVQGALGALADALTSVVHALAGMEGADSSLKAFAETLKFLADAALTIERNVPGATDALGALFLLIGSKKALSVVGLGSAVDLLGAKVGKTASGVAKSSALYKLGADQLDNYRLGVLGASDAAAPLAARLGGVAGKAKGLASSALLAVGGLGGLAVGAAVVGGAAYLLEKHLNSVRDAHDGVTEAAGKLKTAFADEKLSLDQFTTANKNLGNQLKGLSGTQRDASIIEIGFQLVHDGEPPETAFAELQKLALAFGLQLPVGLKASDLADVQKQLDALATTAKRLTDEIQTNMGNVGTKTGEEISGLAKSIAEAFQSGDIAGATRQWGAYEQAVKASGDTVDAQKASLNYLNDEILKNGHFTNVSIDNSRNMAEGLQEIIKSTSGASNVTKDFNRDVLYAYTQTGDWNVATREAADSLAKQTAATAAASGVIDDHAHAMYGNQQNTYLAFLAARQLSGAMDAEASKTRDAALSLDAMHNALIRAQGGSLDMKLATGALFQSVRDLGDSFKTNGDHLDVTTKKGYANQQAIKSLVTAYNDNADAILHNGKSHDKQALALEHSRDDLIKQLQALKDNKGQLLLNKGEIDAVTTAIGKVPKEWKTKFEVDDAAAKAELAHLQGLIRTTAQQGQTAYLDFLNNRASSSDASSTRLTPNLSGATFAGGLAPRALFTTLGARESLAAPRLTAAQQAALNKVTASLKDHSSPDQLAVDYGHLRDALLKSTGPVTAAQAAYDKAAKTLTDLHTKLTAVTSAQTVHAAASTAVTAQARAYLQEQLDEARAHGASKKRIAELTTQLRELGTTHSATAAQQRAAVAVIKAALKDQIAAQKDATDKVKATLATVKAAEKAAQQAANDAAKALIAGITAEVDAFVSQVDAFVGTMSDAITGGALDLSKLWGATTQNIGDLTVFVPGSLDQLQTGLDDRIAAAQQFSDDLAALASSGASQDLNTQLGGLGQEAGDALAKQLLAGGQTSIDNLNSSIAKLKDIGVAGATDLAHTFLSPGGDAITQFIDGMTGKLPELDKFLADLRARVTAALGPGAAAVVSPTAPVVKPVSPVPSAKTSTTTTGTTTKTGTASAKAVTFHVTAAPDIPTAVQLLTLSQQYDKLHAPLGVG